MTPIANKNLPENVKKFLMLITYTEGTDKHGKPYNCLFGHQYFEGYATHPGKVVTIGNIKSSAAGRYQILKKTFVDLKGTSFTPEAQDNLAVALLKRRKAYNLILQGKFREAILNCNKEWASLPGSPYGQPTHSMADALTFLKSLT